MYCIDFYIASFVSHANCCADTLNFSVFTATSTSCLCAIVVVARAIAIVIMAVIIFWYWHLIFDVLLFFALSLFFCASHTLCLFPTSLILSVSFYFESIYNLISKVPINFRNNFFTRNWVARIELNGSGGWITKNENVFITFSPIAKTKEIFTNKMKMWNVMRNWEANIYLRNSNREKEYTHIQWRNPKKRNSIELSESVGLYGCEKERERDSASFVWIAWRECLCANVSVTYRK